MYGAFFGRGIGPVHMASVDCHGNKNCLIQCFYMSSIGVDNYCHGKDVGIIYLGKERESLQYIFSKTKDYAVFYNVTISLSSTSPL